MATNPQLAPEENLAIEPAIRKMTPNQLRQIVYQHLVQHTQAFTDACWQSNVAISDRMGKAMNLVTNIDLAMNRGDYVKNVEWGCNFETETFHKSPTKEAYDVKISQKTLEYFKRRQGNKDIQPEHSRGEDQQMAEAARKGTRSFQSLIRRQKDAGHVRGSLALPPNPRPVTLCREPECEFSTTGYNTQQALQQHIHEEHTKPREDPLKFVQENLALALGLERDGSVKKEPDTEAAANLAIPFSRVSGSPSVPYTITQDRTKGNKAYRSSLLADLGKRNQPQHIAARGVRGGRIVRPSITNKPSWGDRRINP